MDNNVSMVRFIEGPDAQSYSVSKSSEELSTRTKGNPRRCIGNPVHT